MDPDTFKLATAFSQKVPLPERGHHSQRAKRSQSEPATRFPAGMYSDLDFVTSKAEPKFMKIGDSVSLWSEGESSDTTGFISTLG